MTDGDGDGVLVPFPEGRSREAAGRAETPDEKFAREEAERKDLERRNRSLPEPDAHEVVAKEIAPHLSPGATAFPESRFRGVRATPADEDFYRLQFDKAVLTGSHKDARVRIDEARKLDVALVEGDGSAAVLLVNREDETDASVAEVRSLVRRASPRIEIQSVLLVRSAVLVQLYAREMQRTEEGQAVSEDRLVSEAERLFSNMIRRAGALNASDILIAVRETMTAIEFRIDGNLEPIMTKGRDLGLELMNVANFASDESKGGSFNPREHQGTRISGSAREGKTVRLPAGVQSLRLQFLPLMNNGQYIAVRLLYREGMGGGGGSDVDVLGYMPEQVKALRSMRSNPHGLHIIVGVTGSGKSTTLQMNLSALIRESKGALNVMTVEDPPEYTIPGAKQVPVDESDEDRKAALTRTITSAMRADPDVIMIGEIRDGASAQLALTAAMTGHQVWSTLHAISATRSLTRLLEEGLSPGSLLDANVVHGLVAQRLLPVLCEKCSLPWEEGSKQLRFVDHPNFVPRFEEALSEHPWLLEGRDSKVRLVNSGGCGPSNPSCRYGYRGKTVIAEIIVPDDRFMELYLSDGPKAAEQHWVDDLGGVRMAEHGFLKLVGGRVDPLDLAIRAELMKDLDKDRLRSLLDLAARNGFLDHPAEAAVDVADPIEPGASIVDAIAGTGESVAGEALLAGPEKEVRENA